MIRWSLPLGAALLFALAGATLFARHHEITFSRLDDAHTRFAGAGFRCTSDRPDGLLSTGFLISRHAVSFDDVAVLCKVGPMGPQWKGKVWVTQNSRLWQVASMPDRAGLRVWGNIVAYGDEELLNEIDASLGAG